MLPTYSIAIRTLGTAGEKFKKELDSIVAQTIKPEKVVIYIAQGYKRPDYTIGIEEYVEAPKGMVSQRALDYTEIPSEYILMLDDDIELRPNSAELLLQSAIENSADCITVDLYQNHQMSFVSKIYNIFSNLIFPFYSKNWSRKILSNGSISYNNNPSNSKFYNAQAGEGGASLWRKDIINKLNLSDEKWLDNLDFAYAEDQLIFYKIYVNGFKLGTLYNTGIKHLDSGTARKSYQANPSKFITRSQASFIIWYRTLFNIKRISIIKKTYRLLSFTLKQIWLIPVLFIAAIRFKNCKIPFYHFVGIYKGIEFVNSAYFKNISNYKL